MDFIIIKDINFSLLDMVSVTKWVYTIVEHACEKKI